MKKIAIISLLIVLAIVLAGGVFVWVHYQDVDGGDVPQAKVNAFGVPMTMTAYDWQVPVLGGLLHRQMAMVADCDTTPVEVDGPANIALPEGFDSMTITLGSSLGREPLYVGDIRGFDESILEAGQDIVYDLNVQCVAEKGGADGYGTQGLLLLFTMRPPEPEPLPEPEPIPDAPVLKTGATTLQQGDIFAMEVLHLPEGVSPQATTPLGNAVFTPTYSGWFAAVGIGNIREPGTYPVQVQAGDYSWDVTITVEAFPFDEQNLEIDTTDPVISEANSPKAIQQYNDVMLPMYQSYDEERYWDGVFIWPTEGRISTPFGAIRYTNGDYANPSRHWGMDIAADEGVDVVATNAGRVVFADSLLAVGNTVIIEHGGGLKSYHYHMSALHVAEGDMVEKGQLIGEVGSTGYSTGPHLHFEMRLGGREQVVSPTMLFTPGAGLYSTGRGLDHYDDPS